MNARTRAAIEAAARREKALTGEQWREMNMMLLLATHLLLCCPVETLEGGNKHLWHREHQPAINGEGCRCKGVPMKHFGPNDFLSRIEDAA